MSEEILNELSQLFDNRFSCWTHRETSEGDSDFVMAMDRDRFIEVAPEVARILAQHADDGAEEVSEEWLRSIGFNICAHWGAMDIGDWHNSLAVKYDHGEWSLNKCRTNDGCDFVHLIPSLTTRAKVRQLLQALNIEVQG